MSKCTPCGGSGQFRKIIQNKKKCSRCKGSGEIKGSTCYKCKGEKKVLRDIYLPPVACLACGGTGTPKPKKTHYHHKNNTKRPRRQEPQNKPRTEKRHVDNFEPTMGDVWPK
jgi:hypothetical protein